MLKRVGNYQKSNAILTIDFVPSRKACNLVDELKTISNWGQRQDWGAKLLTQLSDETQIPAPKLKISNTRQWHKRVGGRTVFKQYGYYRPRSNYIYIQNLTPVKGQELFPKTFLSTLLHEWMHHYDYQKLKLVSWHTKGFYARLNHLRNHLL